MSKQKYTYSVERYHDHLTSMTHVTVKLYPQGAYGGLTEKEINDLQVLSWSYKGIVTDDEYSKMVTSMLDAYVNIANSRI
ncbi:hypothetical protein [Morganella phage phiA020]